MTVVINGTTGVSGVAGSASTPALIGSDADSGYYINSANEPNASVNGTATWSAASSFGFKNRIINGNMAIDQRNAGASITQSTSSLYGVDRWNCYGSTAGAFTMQQNAGSVTPPAGFKNYLGVTVISPQTFTTGNLFHVSQTIEGYNTADLGFGASGAATVTLSFWVRSSLTGAFGGCLLNSAGDRSYPFSYTISSANTWEQKTITIAGDTSGTWLTTNGAGISLLFGMGSGTSYKTTANAWAAGTYTSPTGSVNLVSTNGATWYVTGVQLEKGSTATSFDFRSYGTELALCQRYCLVDTNDGITYASFGTGASVNSTTGTPRRYFPVKMRASPTLSVSSVGAFILDQGNTAVSTTNITLGGASTTCAAIACTVASGLTGGYSITLVSDASTSLRSITYSAEL